MTFDRGHVLILMLIAAAALALGETALSKGMRQTAAQGGALTAQVRAVALSGWVWAGCALMVIHLGLYMLALRGADLSLALPLTAASYPLAALLAKYGLGESVGSWRWFGTLLITAGVAVVAIGEGSNRPATKGVPPDQPGAASGR
jgi:drug/metabolite transporter (DMT)-like permease